MEVKTHPDPEEEESIRMWRKRVSQPSFLQHIASLNSLIAADLEEEAQQKDKDEVMDRPPRQSIDLEPPKPVQYFERLPEETEEELIKRWKSGFLQYNAPIDQRVTLSHDDCHDYNGYSRPKIQKDAPNRFDHITPEQLGKQPITQDLILSRFLPVIPDALLVMMDDNATIAKDLNAHPVQMEEIPELSKIEID